MNTESRKERERRERGERILDVARRFVVDGGYHGLSMDRIAATLEYSKGTIYNHFGCKEEILAALSLQALEKRSALFMRASTFKGSPRERLEGIGLAAALFVRLFPDHFSVEQIVRVSSIWEKSSEHQRMAIRHCERTCMSIVGGIIRDAIASGDLTLPTGVTVEHLVFGLWSINFGAYSIMATSDSLAELGVEDPFESLIRNIEAMLDGYGWRPLSHDHDYRKVMKRVQTEVFADEIAQSPLR